MGPSLFRRVWLGGLPVILLAACPSPDVTDRGFGTEVWTVEGPVLRIGSVDDPDYAFQTVGALAMSPAGVLHSIHRGEATIRRWGPEGRPAGVIGGRGEGPGEFEAPSRLGFFGDTLWVMDRSRYRVSFFDLTGAFLGSVTPRVDMSRDPDNPSASAPRPVLPLRDGTLYGIAPAWSDAIARGQLSEAKHVWMDADGETLGTVWVQPYRPTDVLALLRETGGTFSSQPFGDAPLFHVSAEGVLHVVDRRVFDGAETPAIRLTRIAMIGDTILAKEIVYTPEPVSQERIDSATHAQAEGMLEFMQRRDPGLTQAKLEADLRAATYSPDYLPAVRNLAVANDGSVWLQRFDPSADGTVWWVLGEDAEPRATAVTPGGLRVLLITGDDLWGVETDELDVNYIVRYQIMRNGQVAGEE